MKTTIEFDKEYREWLEEQSQKTHRSIKGLLQHLISEEESRLHQKKTFEEKMMEP